MNDFERIDFIKQEWKKFLKKKIKKDIDISKIESIVEIKQALKIREAVETISDEFKIDISEEEVVLLSNALISETVIDEKGKILKSKEVICFLSSTIPNIPIVGVGKTGTSVPPTED